MKIVWFVFLGIAAWMDARTRQISVWLYMLFGGIGLLSAAEALWNQKISGVSGYGGLAVSLGIGISLILLGQVTEGAIGAGDGLFFLVSGLYLTWQENLGLLYYGLLCCSMFGLGLILWGNWKGVSVRKQKLPFLPFLLFPGIWVLCL